MGYYDSLDDDNMPKHEIHPMYHPGGPLIPGVTDVAAEFGTAIASLEKHYMDNFRKPQTEQVVGIMGSILPENFHHEGDIVLVFWKDLYELLNMEALELSILRVISL